MCKNYIKKCDKTKILTTPHGNSNLRNIILNSVRWYIYLRNERWVQTKEGDPGPLR